jgi:hypothetical protein
MFQKKLLDEDAVEGEIKYSNYYIGYVLPLKFFCISFE